MRTTKHFLKILFQNPTTHAFCIIISHFLGIYLKLQHIDLLYWYLHLVDVVSDFRNEDCFTLQTKEWPCIFTNKILLIGLSDMQLPNTKLEGLDLSRSHFLVKWETTAPTYSRKNTLWLWFVENVKWLTVTAFPQVYNIVNAWMTTNYIYSNFSGSYNE